MKYLTIIIALTVTFASTQEASALSEFKTAFKKKYAAEIKKGKELSSLAKGCFVCHVKKPKGFTGKMGKEAQNEYGMLLNKLVKGSAKKRKAEAKAKDKADGTPGKQAAKVKAQLIAEFNKAMDEVAKVKSNGGKGPTFGAMIKEGKPPVDIDKAGAHYLESLKKKKTTAEDAAAKKPDAAATEEKAAS